MPRDETIEFVVEPPATGDFTLRRFNTRRWKVWSATKQGILDNPTDFGLPDIGSWQNHMRLDRLEVTGIGAGIFEVVGYYSNVANVKQVAASFQTQTVAVPYNVRGQQIVFGTAASPVYSWEIRQAQIYQSVSRLQIIAFFKSDARILPNGQTAGGFFDIHGRISPRVNELHRFTDGGPWYRFEGADVRLVGTRVFEGGAGESNVVESFYELGYSWVSESGIKLGPEAIPGTAGNVNPPNLPPPTPLPVPTPPPLPIPNPIPFPTTPPPASNSGRDWVIFPDDIPSVLEPSKRYTVPPFEQIVPYRPDGADQNVPFLFYSRLLFPVNAEGWKSLPGMIGP